jgi:hypothetical protein
VPDSQGLAHDPATRTARTRSGRCDPSSPLTRLAALRCVVLCAACVCAGRAQGIQSLGHSPSARTGVSLCRSGKHEPACLQGLGVGIPAQTPAQHARSLPSALRVAAYGIDCACACHACRRRAVCHRKCVIATAAAAWWNAFTCDRCRVGHAGRAVSSLIRGAPRRQATHPHAFALVPSGCCSSACGSAQAVDAHVASDQKRRRRTRLSAVGAVGRRRTISAPSAADSRAVRPAPL